MWIQTSMTIEPPRTEVWRTFLDVERWPQWSPWRLRFEQDSRFELGTPFRVGVRAPVLPFITVMFACRVIALDNPRRISWSGRFLGVPGYHQFTFEDDPAGCLLASQEVFQGPLAPLLSPLRPVLRRQSAAFMSRLRAETMARANAG